MLSKEECLQALDHLKEYVNTDNVDDMVVFSRLIKEHFELVEKYNRLYDECPQKCEMLKQLQDEVDRYKHEYFAMRDLFENPQPYKFEDLKVGMWVYDSKFNKCNLIIEIFDNEILEFYYIMDHVLRYRNMYEDNRFYPVQMANVGCE